MSSGNVGGTCYFLGHSHLDAAWLWPFSETIEVFHDTCETILKLMEKYPDFRYCQSSAQYYKWLEEKYPETFEKVKQKIKEERWELVGGMWVESDGNMPSGESLVRQFLYGKRYFKEKFNVDVKIAWMPDNRPGRWMYHCHIIEHHAAGMMAAFDVIDGSKPYTEQPPTHGHHHH